MSSVILTVMLTLAALFYLSLYVRAQVTLTHPLSSKTPPHIALPRSEAVFDSPEVESELQVRNLELEVAKPTLRPKLTLISTADGFIHAIETLSGAGHKGSGSRSKLHKKWSLSTGGPMMTSFQAASPDMNNFVLVPSVDGMLLRYTSDGMKKIPFKAKTLTDQVPFVSKDGTLFTGSRTSHLLGVDMATGRLLHEISDGDISGVISGGMSAEPNPNGHPSPLPFWISRTDHTIRAIDGQSGEEKWNVTFSEILPLTPNSEPPQLSTDTVSVTPDGEVIFEEPDVHQTQTLILSAPATGAFSLTETRGVESSTRGLNFGGGYVSRPLRLSYRMPKSQPPPPPSSSSSAVVRSLTDGQLYAVIVSPQSSVYNDHPHLPKSSTKTTLPLPPVPHSDRYGPTRSLWSWLSPRYDSQTALSLQPVSSRTGVSDSISHSSDSSQCGRSVSRQCVLGLHSLQAAIDDHTVSSFVPPSSQAHVDKSFASLLPSIEDLSGAGAGGLQSYDSKSGALKSFFNGLLSFRSRSTPDSVSSRWINLFVFFALGLVVMYKATQKIMNGNIRSPKGTTDSSLRTDTSPPPVPPVDVYSADVGADTDLSRQLSDSNVVGSIVMSDDVLGYGSHGTVVFRGTLHRRPVAVKRMLKVFHPAADREIALLIQSDGHPNVVRYYLKEQKGEFLYLALQLCEMSLKDFISRVAHNMARKRLKKSIQEKKTPPVALLGNGELKSGAEDASEIHAPIQLRNALLQIAEGVAHLHSLRIVHRDLKPHNILLAAEGEVTQAIQSLEQLGQFTLKISDMGLGKQLDKDSSSFASVSLQGLPHADADASEVSNASSNATNPMGTIGWQAPELMLTRYDVAVQGETEDNEEATNLLADPNPNPRRTQTVDIFSLGCVFYYTVVPGQHPFGEWYEREANIMRKDLKLEHIQHLDDACDLISKMLSYTPHLRPTAAQVCRHPFFWSSDRRLSFLTEFSDRLEHEEADSSLVLALETHAHHIVGRAWDTRLHASLLEDVARYRKYDTASVRDCLRLIRNKRHHLHELKAQVKDLMSPLPSGFLRYFDSRFPKLFMHCVRVACRHLSLERDFAPFCFALAPLYASYSNCNPVTNSNPLSRTSTEPIETKDGSNDTSPAAQTRVTHPIPVPVHTSPPRPAATLNGHTHSNVTEGLIFWSGSTLTESQQCRGWWRFHETWSSGADVIRKKSRPAHLQTMSTDFKYRTRLCTHWENSKGEVCPMKKKNKCDFAHGPPELRVKENRRNRWGRSQNRAYDAEDSQTILRLSGGEDPLGAARSIEKIRQTEGSLSEFERSSIAGLGTPKRGSPGPRKHRDRDRGR